MKLSTRGRYGLRALLELALNYQKGPLGLRELARRQDISAKYLEQLLIPLKGAGVVNSVRGARGGYLLAKDPSSVTLLEVVKVLEGPLDLVDCVSDPRVCGRAGGCAVRDLWEEMSVRLEDFLKVRTLGQLVEQQRFLGRGDPRSGARD